MRGDATTETEVEEHGGSAAAAESASVERRPSLVKLQFMLKKVTQSPVHQYMGPQEGGLFGGPSAADAADNRQLDVGKNGCSGGLARSNPFYTPDLESSSKGHVMEGAERKTSELDLSSIFGLPPEFRSSPLDLDAEIKPVQNGGHWSGTQKDLLPAPTSSQHLLMSPLTRNATSAAGSFNDVTLSSPDLFKLASAPTQNLAKDSQLKSSDLFKDEGLSRFRAAEWEDLLQTERTREGNLFDADPFTSPSNKKDDLFQSPQPVATNPFHTAAANGSDLFQAVPTESGRLRHKRSPPKYVDAISPSFENTVNPFSSTIPRDLFHDFSSLDDPFSTTPSKQYEPFKDVSNGTPDIFQPYSSKTSSKDLFEITPGSVASVAACTKPSPSCPLEMKTDTLPSSSDLFKATPLKSHPAEPSSDKPLDDVLTTPRRTQHNILQPTPFTRARNLCMPLGQSPPGMTHVSTFKRPPKPLPRPRPPRKEKPPLPEKASVPEKPPVPERPPVPEKPSVPERPPVPEKPPVPERPPVPEKPPMSANPTEPGPAVLKTSPKPAAFRPLPNPVTQRKSKTVDNKPLEPDNYVVFQDILLIGQEKCVEDWPEDSPELSPDFKPSGKLRLRRESLKKKTDSDGGSGEDQEGADGHSKKKDKKFRMSLLSRRGSKDKNIDDVKEAKSRTLPAHYKSSKEFSDLHVSTGETEDWELNGMEHKKKPLKTKVNQLFRRASTISSAPEGKFTNGHSHQESKGTALDDSTGDEEEEEEGREAHYDEADGNGFKKKKKMKIKFVPHRGFAITVEKTEELKGAHGHTPRKGSKDDAFEDVEELKGHSLQSTSKAAFLDEGHFQKTHHASAGLNGDEYPYGTEDCKPKKPTKMKLLHVGRRSSKEDVPSNTGSAKKKSSFSAEELDDDELNGMEDYKLKKPKRKGLIPTPRKSSTNNGQSDTIGYSHQMPQQAFNEAVAEDGITQSRKAFMSPEDLYDSQHDEPEACKPKKPLKLKIRKKHKAKSKAMSLECEAPPGATSSDYLSEAAKAEWLAAQMDERAMADLEDEDEEGDTDSLMEWWNTVEQWDEVPSDDEDKVIKEDECKSFTILADKVQRGLRVFNKVFMERAEVLWQSVITLHAIADKISDFHQKAKIAGITGGTTTAVGGVTAIAGLALAPFTFGASLVITAVGVGVATAGGITSASAAISDNVNNMHDRKKVETVLEEYEAHLLDIGKILHFVNQGLYKLRGHPFLRSGTQHYSEDWEIRRAVQMISLVDTPVMRAVDITDSAIASVQGLFNGMDKYFLKDTRELKKGCKTEVVGQIKEVANGLNDGIVALNAIREELQDATGNI